MEVQGISMSYKNWAAAMSSSCGHSLLDDYGPP